MPMPDGTLAVAVAVPHGRETSSILADIGRSRALLKPHTDPRTDKPIYVHPHPFMVIGDEYARGRNELVHLLFRAEAEMKMTWDYVLWLDDDVIPPDNVVEALLAHDVALCSGLYFMRKAPYLPSAYVKVSDPDYSHRFWNITAFPESGLMEVDACGMGCVLIAMEVFRRMPEPWFAWVVPDVQRPDPVGRKQLEAEWQRLDHKGIGEDFFFFTKAAQYGYRLSLDTGVLCGHVGEQVFDQSFFREHQALYFRHASPGKMSICFVTAPAPKPWDGESLYNAPLGGSESAVAYLARSLARKHHTVFVVCNTPGDRIIDVDGVCYRPHSVLHRIMQYTWDALVISRWVDAIDMPMVNHKAMVFWAHNVMDGPGLVKSHGLHLEYGDGPDAYVALTPFHKHISSVSYPTLWTEQFIIPNGLDLTLFDGLQDVERDMDRIIWTQNPNRGLMNPVRIFRELRAQWPALTFHIYGRSSVYGWNPTDPMHESLYLPDPDEPGVYVHEPLTKKELARELAASGSMLYGSTWAETFAISVTEAQLAGTPVIAPPYAALPDTVQGGILTWDFLPAFEQLRDPKEWQRLSLLGREFARHLSWDDIATT